MPAVVVGQLVHLVAADLDGVPDLLVGPDLDAVAHEMAARVDISSDDVRPPLLRLLDLVDGGLVHFGLPGDVAVAADGDVGDRSRISVPALPTGAVRFQPLRQI